jgi:hypothetical protein
MTDEHGSRDLQAAIVKVIGRTGYVAAYAVHDFLHRSSGRVACIGMLLSFGLRLLPVSPISVQLQSNSRGWLHRGFPRKRHQMRHLCDFACFLAKQVLSQLSYTPTVVVTSILKHSSACRNPFLRFSVILDVSAARCPVRNLALVRLKTSLRPEVIDLMPRDST